MGLTEMIISRGKTSRRSGEELSEELVDLIMMCKKHIMRMCEIVKEMEDYGYSQRMREGYSQSMRESDEDYKIRR